MNNTPSLQLHLQTVPARNGLLWIRHGFKVFQRKPLALASLLLTFFFLALLLLLVPAAGVLVLLMALPLLSLGFMLATHLVLQNQTPTAAVFIAPLKLTPQRRKTQLMLGLAYASGVLLIALLVNWIDNGSAEALQRLWASGASNEQMSAAAADPRLLWSTLARVVLTVLLSVPFWHAPALVHWGGQGLMQALFSSTLGIWRNKAAFALNMLMWGGLLMASSMLLSLVALLPGMSALLMLVALPLGLVLSTVFYAT
ncbi:MAG: BPSS1780 family membrane protein, partial [Burkholderiaceae bacterium]